MQFCSKPIFPPPSASIEERVAFYRQTNYYLSCRMQSIQNLLVELAQEMDRNNEREAGITLRNLARTLSTAECEFLKKREPLPAKLQEELSHAILTHKFNGG